MSKEIQFQEIYDSFNKMVYNLAINYLQNIEDAEEITQDVFVQIFHSLDKFEQNATYKTWVYRITINKCLDHLKAKKRKKRIAFLSSIFNSDGKIIHDSIEFIHPGSIMEEKENLKILFQCIDELPDNQKTSFFLSKIEGLSNKDISEIMKASISSVESYLFRAKQNLQINIQKKYPALHKNNKK
jgi:RNA polymerase sigma-70 factor (ECF subfamily)